MRAQDKSARQGTGPHDPLEQALRQMGADMLDEPVPERLRQVLRRAREESRHEPTSGERTRRTDGR